MASAGTWTHLTGNKDMNRIQKTLTMIAAFAITAAAHGMFKPAERSLCFASGATTYQIARNALAPDFHIKIAGDVPHADLRMQLVDRAEIADFVLVDDFGAADQMPCRPTTAIKTVTLDTNSVAPDVTVALSADTSAADYRLYLHSVRFSQQEVAAILAAMWRANTRDQDIK